MYKSELFGHVITKNGIAVDSQKIEVVSNQPKLITPRAMKSLLGFTGYCRKFIKGYGGIAAPLNAMLKKGSFSWNEESLTTFETLKEAMYTFNSENAKFLSWTLLQNVILQEVEQGQYSCKRIIQWLIQVKLKEKALQLPAHEKEMLAILYAVKKWKKYFLIGYFY